MGAAVSQTKHRPGVLDHLVDGIAVAIAVVEQGEEQEFPALLTEHAVVEDVLGAATFALGDPRDTVLLGGFVVGLLAQGKELVEARHHVGRHGIVVVHLFRKNCRPNFRLAQARDSFLEGQLH